MKTRKKNSVVETPEMALTLDVNVNASHVLMLLPLIGSRSEAIIRKAVFKHMVSSMIVRHYVEGKSLIIPSGMCEAYGVTATEMEEMKAHYLHFYKDKLTRKDTK